MKITLSIICFVLITICNAISQENECVFDLETQTNEFLKNTDLWNNHDWDSKTKTATIYASDHETLEITRGGCDHFSYYLTLTLNDDQTELIDYDYWLDHILLWARALNDFDIDQFESVNTMTLKPNSESINQVVWYLEQELYCSSEIWIEKEGSKTKITIGYYLC